MRKGYFGDHGGQFVPETLMNAIIELEEAYEFYKNDSDFLREFSALLDDYASRPSRLYHAQKMSKDLGVKIYLKREDLNHTGSHKINNVLGQALLAKKNGQNAHHRRNWRRTAWRGERYGRGIAWHGV